MKKNFGVNDISKWKFEKPEIPKDWEHHIGAIPHGFRMYVDGDPGHGKTEYLMMITKMLAMYFGKTHYNNVEQGKHEGIMDSHERNEFAGDVRPGTWMYNMINDFEGYKQKMKRDRPRVMALDSISYFPLSVKQVQELHELFPKKSMIFVGYLDHYKQNKAIVHLCDVKVRVQDFIAYPRSRYGGNKPFIISQELNTEMRLMKKGKNLGTGSLF